VWNEGASDTSAINQLHNEEILEAKAGLKDCRTLLGSHSIKLSQGYHRAAIAKMSKSLSRESLLG